LFQPCEALSSSRRWDPLWEVETDVGGALGDASRAPGCYASGGPSGVFEFVKEKQKDGDCGDVEDSMNVDDLSELLTHIEAQEEDEGVDFSVFIEDEDALNVEEISDVFSALEDVAGDLLPLTTDTSSSSRRNSGALSWEEDEDAQNVDAVSELFSSLEQADAEERSVVSEENVCDAANVDEVSDLFSSLEEECSADDDATEAFQVETDKEDAANVDSMADMFSALEGSAIGSGGDGVDKLTQPDWIDSLEVENMSSLFSEMERKSAAQLPPVVAMPSSAPVVKVDSRIFMPKFSVRIEGSAAAGRVPPKPLVHLGSSSSSSACGSRLLAGPPVFLAGPPQLSAANSLSREDRVERWKEKRKARSFVPREPDAVVSDTRRACAAKRQRVKGRFTSEKCAFVSITALQSS
jgi:hypothetical protein